MKGNAIMQRNFEPSFRLALAAKESGVMYCTEGKIVQGDGSLVDRAVEEGRFQCTSWKLRGEGSFTVKGAMPWPTSPRR